MTEPETETPTETRTLTEICAEPETKTVNETFATRDRLPATEETLVIGWGNPGRCDDGLGPALVAAVETLGPPGVRFDSDYQLQIENAAEVARYARVLFVDADRGGHEPFSMRRLLPAAGSLSFSTHSVRPEAILALARDLFNAEPEAWLLGIHGYDFDDFGEGLSAGAQANLAAATEFVEQALTKHDFHEVGTAGSAHPADDAHPLATSHTADTAGPTEITHPVDIPHRTTGTRSESSISPPSDLHCEG